MRLLAVSCLSLVCGIAFADELIDIPTARKIATEDFRYEFRAQPITKGDMQHFLGIGLGKSFELDIREVQDYGMSPVTSFDFSYNFMAAFPGGEIPGISLGVQDGSNLTQDGRRFFAVTTFRNTMDEIAGSVYADITLGFQVGSKTSPFVGVAVPFAPSVYLLAEDSGFRLNTGIEFRPSARMSLRFIVRNQETLLSLSASGRF